MSETGTGAQRKQPKQADVEIGARIKRAREAQGLSQNDFSAALNARGLNTIVGQTVNKIEQGTRRVLASELTIIASILGVDVGLLIGLSAADETRLDRAEILSAGARLEEAMRNMQSASVAYANAVVSFAQTADQADSLHESDRHYAATSLPRQTPSWIASSSIESIEATLRLKRITIQEGFAKQVLDSMRADYQHFHERDHG